MAEKRTSKEIKKKEDIDFLLSLDADDIGQDLIMDMFGVFNESEQRFDTYDIFTIPPKMYGNGKKNKNPIVTTVGRYIFNKCFIEANPTIFAKVGYFNEPMTDGNYSDLMEQMGYWMLEEDVSVKDYKRFCNTVQTFMPIVAIIAPGFSEAMLTCTKKINAKKEQLLKQNKAAIDAGDLVVIDRIQKELLDYARDLLAEDPSMDMFRSGAMGSFDNNFKNMFVMRGTVRDPDPSRGYHVITSNYIDGVSADEYDAFANTLAEGPYNRSKKTEVGGYWEKLLVAACQHQNLLAQGTDCGSTHTIEVNLTKKNLSTVMYSYIVEGDKLVELTSKNKDKYIGKKIRIRYSSMCKAKDGICSRCAGNAFYRQGITNVGVRVAEIPSKIKNIFMKSFHDSQVRLFEMDPMKAFGLSE